MHAVIFVDGERIRIFGFFTSTMPYQLMALGNPNNFLFDFPLALVPAFAVPLSTLAYFLPARFTQKDLIPLKNKEL